MAVMELLMSKGRFKGSSHCKEHPYTVLGCCIRMFTARDS